MVGGGALYPGDKHLTGGIPTLSFYIKGLSGRRGQWYKGIYGQGEIGAWEEGVKGEKKETER